MLVLHVSLFRFLRVLIGPQPNSPSDWTLHGCRTLTLPYFSCSFTNPLDWVSMTEGT